MKSFAWAALLLFCLGLPAALCGVTAAGSGNAALTTAGGEEEPVIPPGAQEKAIQALKALGPDRGARMISSAMVNILGTTKGLAFDSRQVQKNLKDLGARETKTDIQIELSGDVLFDFDRWDLRPDAEESLKKIGGIIKAYQSPAVVIAGYTDSKGQADYNQKLSLKRADAVKAWLVSKAGVEAGVIKTEGFGPARPAAPNTNPDGSDNPQGRQKNRRVEVVIKKKS